MWLSANFTEQGGGREASGSFRVARVQPEMRHRSVLLFFLVFLLMKSTLYLPCSVRFTNWAIFSVFVRGCIALVK
jgi:hypothetical protein